MAATTIPEEPTKSIPQIATESRAMLDRLLASDDERRKRVIHTTLEACETARLMEAEESGAAMTPKSTTDNRSEVTKLDGGILEAHRQLQVCLDASYRDEVIHLLDLMYCATLGDGWSEQILERLGGIRVSVTTWTEDSDGVEAKYGASQYLLDRVFEGDHPLRQKAVFELLKSWHPE